MTKDDPSNCYHDQRARMRQLEIWQSKSDEPKSKNLRTLIDNVIGWHYDRNLIEGSTDKDQVLKLAQELGELSDSVCKGKDI